MTCVQERMVIVLAVVAGLSTVAIARGGTAALDQAQPTQATRAGDKYRNLQIFQDVPASDLLRLMHLMRASLGTRCDFCHDVERYEADAKQTKVTARQMIRMVFDLNRNVFGGRQVVTCNTCHRGATRPATVPTIEQGLFSDTTQSPPAQPRELPSAATILERYVAAVGGRSALRAVKERVGEATLSRMLVVRGPDGVARAVNRGQTDPITIRTQGPDQLSLTIGAASIVIDKGKGVVSSGSSEVVLGPEDVESYTMRFSLRFELALADAASMFTVRGPDLLDGRAVSVLERRLPDGRRDRLYFDDLDGFLRRRVLFRPTVLGEDPRQIDFEDYRTIDGIRVPFMIRTSVLDDNHDGTTVHFLLIVDRR